MDLYHSSNFAFFLVYMLELLIFECKLHIIQHPDVHVFARI